MLKERNLCIWRPGDVQWTIVCNRKQLKIFQMSNSRRTDKQIHGIFIKWNTKVSELQPEESIQLNHRMTSCSRIHILWDWFLKSRKTKLNTLLSGDSQCVAKLQRKTVNEKKKTSRELGVGTGKRNEGSRSGE